MDNIVLGAYATEQEAMDAMALRHEPQDDLFIENDGDADHPWRVHWNRTG